MTAKKPTPERLEVLSVPCLCDEEQEMMNKTPPAQNGYRKFYCASCRSTLWLSPVAFSQADADQKIMQAG